MFASHPAVHPLDLELPAEPVNPPPGVLVQDLPGTLGTPGGLFLYAMQIFFATASLLFLYYSVDFHTLKVFWYLVAADILLCTWSLCIGSLGLYAVLVNRSFRSYRAVALFAIGDGITWLVTFTGASAAAGVSHFLNSDIKICSDKHNNCAPFKTAWIMAFLCLLSLSASLVLNLVLFASVNI